MRFVQDKKSSHNFIRIILPAAVFAAIVVLFIVFAGNLNDQTTERQRESLEKAINRDIAFCYAIEGAYPESLDYLKENFALTYDEDLFFVDYRLLASNIYPDVTIIEVKQE